MCGQSGSFAGWQAARVRHSQRCQRAAVSEPQAKLGSQRERGNQRQGGPRALGARTRVGPLIRNPSAGLVELRALLVGRWQATRVLFGSGRFARVVGVDAGRSCPARTNALARPSQLDGPPVWIDEHRIFSSFLPEGHTAQSIVDVIDPPRAAVSATDQLTLRTSKTDEFLCGGCTRIWESSTYAPARWSGSSKVETSGAGHCHPMRRMLPSINGWAPGSLISSSDRSTRFSIERSSFNPRYSWAPDGARLYYETSC